MLGVLMTLYDISRGRALFDLLPFWIHFNQAENPIMFWISIAIEGAVAVLLVFSPLLFH